MKAFYCTFFVRILLSTTYRIGTSRFIYCKFKFSCKKRYHLISSKDFLVSGGELMALYFATLPILYEKLI
jgi:hypothetical protein